MERIAKAKGARVFHQSLDDISGFLYREKDQSVIGVNTTTRPCARISPRLTSSAICYYMTTALNLRLRSELGMGLDKLQRLSIANGLGGKTVGEGGGDRKFYCTHKVP